MSTILLEANLDMANPVKCKIYIKNDPVNIPEVHYSRAIYFYVALSLKSCIDHMGV